MIKYLIQFKNIKGKWKPMFNSRLYSLAYAKRMIRELESEGFKCRILEEKIKTCPKCKQEIREVKK